MEKDSRSQTGGRGDTDEEDIKYMYAEKTAVVVVEVKKHKRFSGDR